MCPVRAFRLLIICGSLPILNYECRKFISGERVPRGIALRIDNVAVTYKECIYRKWVSVRHDLHANELTANAKLRLDTFGDSVDQPVVEPSRSWWKV